MRILFRRYYPMILAICVFIFFQVFVKLNEIASQSRKSLYDALSQQENNVQVDHIAGDNQENILYDIPNEENLIPELQDSMDIKKSKELDKVPEKQTDNDVNKQNVNEVDTESRQKPKVSVKTQRKVTKEDDSNKSDALFQPDEVEAKRVIAEDALNDENQNVEPVKAPEDRDQELFVFPDEEEDANIYKLDYSASHAFENECRYPVLQRNEPDLLKHVRHYRRVDCPLPKNNTVPMISQLPSGELMIGIPHRAKLRSSIKCMGRELSGTLRKDKRKVKEIGDWFEIPQDRRVFVNKDQFIVKCKDKGGREILTDIFTSLPEKPRLKPESVDQPDKYNIDIFVLDSTARNQFFRHMPLTLKFMRNMDFKFLHGHTKVGDNSAINLLPLLAGKVYDFDRRGFEEIVRDDMILTPEMLKEDFWKQVKLLFVQYSDMLIQIARDQGCPTLWNDDIATVGFGLFNYYAFPGFVKPPADFYYRPYYHYLYEKLKATTSCINGEFLAPRYVQIWERFARRFAKECHFAFNFITGLTHASSSNVELYDQHLVESLNRMEQDGVFEHSFVIIMGDHGQRISAIQRTFVGRIEERMPLVSIYVPEKFRAKYPDKVKQLEINQNRLTSNFDLHEMLREIMGLDTNREPVGRSLFKSIPRNRNCSDARIPVNFCVCQEEFNEGALKPNDKADINDVFMKEIGAYFTSDCIKSHRIIAPKNFRPFTISNQVRLGIRYLEKHSVPKIDDNEIYDVELDPIVDVAMSKPERTIRVDLKVRVFWDRLNQQGRLTAPPLITNQPCGGIRLLDEICKCNEETKN